MLFLKMKARIIGLIRNYILFLAPFPFFPSFFLPFLLFQNKRRRARATFERTKERPLTALSLLPIFAPVQRALTA